MFMLWLYKFRNGCISVHKLSTPQRYSKAVAMCEMYWRMGLPVAMIVDYGDDGKDFFHKNYSDKYFDKDCTFRRY